MKKVEKPFYKCSPLLGEKERSSEGSRKYLLANKLLITLYRPKTKKQIDSNEVEYVFYILLIRCERLRKNNKD